MNSPKYLIVAQQKAARKGVPNKANKITNFEKVKVRKCFADIDGARYPRDPVSIGFASNDYLDHYRVLKCFSKGYVGEELLSPFINYTDKSFILLKSLI